MMELTPLVSDSTRGSHPGLSEDSPKKGTWRKMMVVALAVIGIVAVGTGLVMPTKMNNPRLTSGVTPKEAVLAPNAHDSPVEPKGTDDSATRGKVVHNLDEEEPKGESIRVSQQTVPTGLPFGSATLDMGSGGLSVTLLQGSTLQNNPTGFTAKITVTNGKCYNPKLKLELYSLDHSPAQPAEHIIWSVKQGTAAAQDVDTCLLPLSTTNLICPGTLYWLQCLPSYTGLNTINAGETIEVGMRPKGPSGQIGFCHVVLNGKKYYWLGRITLTCSHACPAGKYLASKACHDCPVGYSCAMDKKTMCPAGYSQPSTGKSTCLKAPCGKFVPAPGGTMTQTCRAGTFSDAGASSCTPVGKGEYSGPGACAPKKCGEGTYQDCEGQAQCNPAPCGHYVSGLGQTGYTECPAGQYQPKEGQKSCLDVPEGSYSGKGHCKPRLCMPGTFQPKKGQPTCDEAQCGYFVSTPGSTKEEMCANGFYQPEKGQPTCLGIPDGHIAIQNACAIKCCDAGTYRTPAFTCVDAPCGKKVPAKCAMAPMACPPGEYTDASGASACKKAPLGSIPNADQCGTKKCDPGKYQNVVGGTVCKTTQCGYYTNNPGSPAELKCPMGTYQDKTGQTGCIDCKAGTANNQLGKCSCPDCTKGTYQPATGKQTCKDAPCGSFVPGTGATQYQKCPPGEYQDQTGQWMCKPAPAGSFAVGGTCNPETCPAGTYTGTPGQTKCTSAKCGHYVDSAGQTSETACPAGKYQPLVGQTSCLDAPTGSYTSSSGKCEETLCLPGNFQPQTGQTMCKPADCGHYVAISGSATQSPCGPGRFQPDTGKTGCKKAAQGKFVAGKGSCKEEPCPMGSYTDCEGQSECIKAPCGYFVDATGKKGMSQCAPGTYQDLAGQSGCLQNPPGTFSKVGYCKAQQCDPGTFQPQGGQDKCKAASCGNFVDGEGRKQEAKCAAGSYQPKTGQVGCLPTTYGNAPNPGTCTKGNVAGGIFYAGPSTMTWEEAKKYCMSNGDRLAIVKSQMEHDEVKGVCPDASKHCWLGGSDIAKEGTWRWIDGSLVDSGFKNWGKGEPNALANEHCMMTWCNGDCWNDIPCTSTYFPVCERRLPRPQLGINLAGIASLAKATECFSGACYQLTPAKNPSPMTFNGNGGYVAFDGTGAGKFPGTEKLYPSAVAPSLTVYAKFSIASDMTTSDWVAIAGKAKSFYERTWALWAHLTPDKSQAQFLFQSLYTKDGAKHWSAGVTLPVTLNSPMTLTGVYDANAKVLKLYVNGAFKGQAQMSEAMPVFDVPVTLGGVTFHTAFKGKIYEFAYYEFGMSASQVTVLNALGVKCPGW